MSFDFNPNEQPQNPVGDNTTTVQQPPAGPTVTGGQTQPQPIANPPHPNQISTPPVAPPTPPAQAPLEYLTKLKTSKSGNAIVGACQPKVLSNGISIPALFFCISKAKDGTGYHLSIKPNQPQTQGQGQGGGVPF